MSLYTLTVDLLMKTGSFETGMTKAERLASQKATQIHASMTRVATVAGAALGTAAAAVGTAVFTWTKQVGQLAVEYDRLGKLSGTTSQDFQRMAAGARTVGISQEKLADIFKDVQEKIGDYAQTGGGEMKDFFDNIAKGSGLTVESFRKLSGPDALGLYFKSLEKANLSQSELTSYMEAIASDSAMLIPLLRNNSAEFNRMGNAAEAAGSIIDVQLTQAMLGMRDVTNRAELSLQGMKVQVVSGIMPALQDFTDQLDAVAVNGNFAKEAADALSGAIRGVTDAVRDGGAVVDFFDRIRGGLVGVEKQGHAAFKLATGQYAFGGGGWEGFKNEYAQGTAYADNGWKAMQPKTARRPSVTVLEGSERMPEWALLPATPDAYEPRKPTSKGSAAKTGNAAYDRQAELLRRYTAEADMAAATMAGPLAEAEQKHKQRLAELNKELAAGNITRAAFNMLEKESAAQLAATTAELDKRKRAPQALLDTMSGELDMMRLIGPARERARREMQNQRDMQEAINEANAAGAGITADLSDSLMAQARAAAQASIDADKYAASLQQWADVGTYLVSDTADAMANFVAGGLRDWSGMWDDMKDVAKQGLRDIARQLLEQKLVIPIQTRILDSINGFGSGNGMSLNSVLGVLGGNGSAAGGQNAGTVAGLLSKGQGLFGFGRSAGAASGTLTGFGDVTSMAGMTGSNFAGLIGGGSAGASAGAGAASSAAAAVPIIGWIVAGMMKNAQLFDQGWNIANGESWAGKIATAGAVGLADKAFRGIGFNDKVASILSGSSIHAKLFGRQAPKVTGQGITGSYGFGGFDGQSYADIKAKGGLFRSDKKWTQFGALDPGIDRTFDMAARQVRGASTDLAKQLGVDLSQQLAGVKVSLGKLTLSADSAEAKEQLAAYLGDMTDRLFTEAVKAAGFGGQLDGYFEASDVFNALSASIALAVGNADELGRALNGLEIDKVNKAVDYFQDLAGVAGTDLATQITKVSGLLGNYSTLMADVSTQLLTGDLTAYQQQALSIERTYRQQVKSANDYAKALGLSGARAEDLAKIESLRATNMGKLQAQIDKDKKAISYGLSVSDLSPLTDQEKLQKTMQELERAVAGGDSSAAQAAAQAALGFGRNLYASGQDYNSLYGQVTGLIDGMKVGDLDKGGIGMGELADTIEALPDNFARAVFDLVVDNKAQAATTAAVQQSNALLAQVVDRLDRLEAVTTQGVRTTSSSTLRTSLNR
ncbi:TPA: phage tail protein [Stenotrophomonas maltophilia]|uniref:phage tail protein n=1 Tax=Stenotrophomonas maltophilia TaxID=40324 RepID=UPI000B51AF69|nr:phage tail protein [Stenotrophomonas maltophilia]ASE52977.1 phage tail protein [Stenotrophomonas maltophilia]HEL4827779.1 phage tail protein [Stenotrophomonas maltophilia]HEL5082598.1 phage tail protein [Stenotrophomonas maltophilia]HEL5363326.1 phage tail protein [Stenotrophomonas maltophilia]